MAASPELLAPRGRVAPASLRDVLRASTAQAHLALEHTPLMRAVSHDVPEPAAYAAYLIAQWRLHAPLEDQLRPWVPAPWVAQRLVKTAWLEHDLHAMGLSPPRVAPLDLAITSHAAAMGAMYVLEGATLGLHVVTRRLPPEHPARQGAGRFMAAYGELTGARWSELQQSLASVPTAHWPAACTTATDTFALFHALFDRSWPCRSDMSR